ncbi:MAG: ParB N-terminal domain-containing protein [Bacteroidetes bacterium]|nr:ParB N-terminal domain-containing protein [Bacteroidota bacterium]
MFEYESSNALVTNIRESIDKTKSFVVTNFDGSNHTYKASLQIFSAHKLNEIGIHKLNPRNPEGLTQESLQDIMPSIESNGLQEYPILVKNKMGIFENLDGLRRQFCMKLLGKEMSAWCIDDDVSDMHAIQLINMRSSVKKHSLREEGTAILKLLSNKYPNEDFSKITRKIVKLGVDNTIYQEEGVRRRLRAFFVAPELVDVFPSCEDIPADYYRRLAAIQVAANREVISLNAFIAGADLSALVKDNDLSLQDKHCQIMKKMELYKVQISPRKNHWVTETFGNFPDEHKYTKVLQNRKSGKFHVELALHDEAKYKELLAYIKENFS